MPENSIGLFPDVGFSHLAGGMAGGGAVGESELQHRLGLRVAVKPSGDFVGFCGIFGDVKERFSRL